MRVEHDVTEDQLVWSFFSQKTTGFFVDVGANHPYKWSQTWLLEKSGWRGILIEPQEVYYELLRQERKNSVVWRAACSSPKKRGDALLYIPNDNPGVATLQKNADDPDTRYDRSEKVQILTLDEILIKAGRPSIDFLSLDVEGTELDVLEGFDLAGYRPKLILIEDKCQSPRKHFYLRRAGYRFVRRTGFNNWYVPKEDSRCKIRLGQRAEFVLQNVFSIAIQTISTLSCFATNLAPSIREAPLEAASLSFAPTLGFTTLRLIKLLSVVTFNPIQVSISCH